MKDFLKKIVAKALAWEAKLLLNHQNPKIIAVTGSVGKTSATSAIHALISSKFHARKSKKSFNSEFGVPLTILGLDTAWSNPFKWIWNLKLGFWRIFFSKNYPKVLVLEIGADHPDDIKKITQWVKPDVAVVTALADVPVHVANFSGPEAVWEEKGRLVEALGPGGIAVLNGDDRRVLDMRQKTAAKAITYGIQDGEEAYTIPDIMATKPDIAYDDKGKPAGTKFQVDCGGAVCDIEIQHGLGDGHVYSALAALGVAQALGMDMADIQEGIKQITTPAGRMKIIPGIKGSTIIDDSYNSSPVAAQMALKTLSQIKTNGRKIAALGDMRELGQFAESEHKKIGAEVSNIAHILVTVGPNGRFVAEGALDHGMDEQNIHQFENSREAGEFLQAMVQEGDIVLAKGSQNTIRMEWLVEEIMAEPHRRTELLVRQDKEWETRALPLS